MMKFNQWLKEDITIPINIGDTVLGGKFKNKRIVVKEIGKNEKGDITLNGKPLMKYRVIAQELEESSNLGIIAGVEGKFKQYLNINEEVTPQELTDIVNRWKNQLKSYGVTWVEPSIHFKAERINDKRNVPPLKVEELDFVMDGFLRKVGSQFKKDVENVKNHTARRRGKNKNKIPENEFEFTVKSVSTKVNLVFVLKQDRNEKGTAVIVPMTVMRKKNFGTLKGDEVIVERRRYNKGEILWT